MSDRGARFATVEYSNWRQGNIYAGLRRAVPGSDAYNSLNMQVYESGALGVRPWCRVWANTAPNHEADAIDNRANIKWRPQPDDGPEGELWVHGFNAGAYQIDYYDFATSQWAAAPANLDTYIGTSIDNRAYTWGLQQDWAASQLAGSAVYGEVPFEHWMVNGEGGVDSGDTAFAISWAGGLLRITNFTLYRDRIYGWRWIDNTATLGNRLYYTDASDYRTQTNTSQYIDIGSPSKYFYIIGAWPVRDALLVAMSNGDWWSLTGEPDTGVLRFIGSYPIPAHGAAATVYNNQLLFQMPFGNGLAVATPSGVDASSLAVITPTGVDNSDPSPEDYRLLSSAIQQAVHTLYVDTPATRKWFAGNELVNGAWTWQGYSRKTFDQETGTIGVLRDGTVVGSGTAYAFLVEDSAATYEAQILTRDICLNRPSNSDDFWSDSTEDDANGNTSISKGAVLLAPFTVAPGNLVKVKQVTVDFQYWKDDAGKFATPTMRCRLHRGPHDIAETINTFSVTGYSSFDDLGDSLPENQGIPSRHVFVPTNETTHPWPQIQVEIDTIMSLAIDRIVVEYEIVPGSHWAGRVEDI